MQQSKKHTGTYLNELNELQKQAVTSMDGPVLVVAGPGSGKTRVLTYRIAHLIEQGVIPWQIMALTFTNKAAREMQDRIEEVVGERARQVWAGTFHSIFARILRVEAKHIGYPSDFTIYDTEDTKSVISSIISEMNLNKEFYSTNAIRTRISNCKSNLITPKLYETKPELMEEDRLARRPYFLEIYKKYNDKCRRSGAMDFDDLLFRLYELFQKHTDVLQKYRDRFKYLLVDEFQDTNFLQYAIVRKFVNYTGSAMNICVVGDDAQSIYAFRGATIQNILDFEEDFSKHGIRIFKLEQNYRSTNHIVQAANQVIAKNQRQIPKTIYSDKGDGHKIRVLRAMTDEEEAKRVADNILEQKNRWHISNKEIAILYRTNAQSRVFEEKLRFYNIPYRVFGGVSFYQRKEVKDLIAYLRLALNPNDDEALKRVINYPRRGIGDASLGKLNDVANGLGKSLWEVLGTTDVGSRTNAAISEFVHIIEDFSKKALSANAFDVARHIAKQSGLLGLLAEDSSIEGIQRLENVNSLLDGIKSFVEDDVVTEAVPGNPDNDIFQNDKSLASYLQNIALLTDLDEASGEEDRITLMSVHSAKGLEFKSVFVAGLEEELFPSILSKDTPESIDEERRLFYVAITRAEEFLTLSFAMSRYRYGQIRYNSHSRFLEEINTQHLLLDAPLHAGVNSAPKWQERLTKTISKPFSGVSGNFSKPKPLTAAIPKVTDFKPSDPMKIQPGMKVLHDRYGEGKVIAIDGTGEKRVATVFFSHLDADNQKRIMLRFSKLQIME
jgi:DNA helicase-2/ATP-dependent DNA helicase PcrA